MVVGVGLAWRGQDGFEVLVDGTAPVFWLFFLLTGLAVFVRISRRLRGAGDRFCIRWFQSLRSLHHRLISQPPVGA